MIVLNQEISPEKFDRLIADIKEKKELRAIESSIVIESISAFLQLNPKILREFAVREDFDNFRRGSGYKKIIKYVRAFLRRAVGAYHKQGYKNNKQLLENLNGIIQSEGLLSPKSLEMHKHILATHSSTAERLKSYAPLYKMLFKAACLPKTILDLGCGLNPLSLPWMGLPKLDYYAVDLNQDNLDIAKKYFEIAGIKGFVKRLNLRDITKTNVLLQFPKVEMCFMFKLLEVVEIKGHKIAELLISHVKAGWIVASFATKTLSGKRMALKRRFWFEKLLRRLCFDFSILEMETEIFYIIHKY